jgi:wyosine [tRNA(Phe)-imidazoG37] synthetase (radical SAM superfamily)
MIHKHLFGPVPSRRLGFSLGVDLLPFKTCSLDCIYCECGATTNLTNVISEYVPTNEVIRELDDYLKKKPVLDYITFSGSGEPTLHSGIGKIINFLKTDYPDYKIALLTNGMLLFDKKVQTDIKDVDLILPSIDAISIESFRKINRPCDNIDYKKVLDGIIDFKKTFKGIMWVEVFIVPGINDNNEEIKLFKEYFTKLKPDMIQLNSLDRPGTEDWVKKADKSILEKIKKQLSPLNVQIIAKYKHKSEEEHISLEKINEKIISILTRRPSTFDDLLIGLNIEPIELNKHLNYLLEKNLIEIVIKERGEFYKIKN